MMGTGGDGFGSDGDVVQRPYPCRPLDNSELTLYKAVACILPLKGTVTETGGGSYIATIDK